MHPVDPHLNTDKYGYEIPDGEVFDGVGGPARGDDFRKGA
jgi:hypothetical protein